MVNCWRDRNFLTPCDGCNVALLDLPDNRQLGAYDCGRAVALTKLLFHGVPDVEAATMVGRLPMDENDGTSPGNFAAWFRQERWKVVEGWMDIDDVRHHCSKGRPVILLAQLHGIGHWVIARGVSRGTVYLQDPNAGRTKMKSDEFARVWHDVDRFARYEQWGIVAVPP
jgi:hypothetical protein